MTFARVVINLIFFSFLFWSGYKDVVIGAPYYTSSVGTWVGRIFIYAGSVGGLIKVQTIVGTTADWRLGFSVAGGLSIDGDSYNDVVCGLPTAKKVLYECEVG